MGPQAPPARFTVSLGLSHILESGAKGFCGYSGQSAEMGQGCFILRLSPIRGYLSRRPGTDYWHHRLCLPAPNPRISVKRGSMARQVWEIPCTHHDRRWQSRHLEKGARATSACLDGLAQFVDSMPLCPHSGWPRSCSTCCSG